nr:photosystem II protein K [Selaginella stauntoniana]
MLDIYTESFTPSTISAKSPEAYAASDPTANTMPITPLLPLPLALAWQASVSFR